MPNIILLAELKPFGADASEKLEPIKRNWFGLYCKQLENENNSHL